MRATRSRTITALLAAVGAGFAISTMIGAPTAIAQVCEPGQIEIDGQCTVPDNNANNVPAPQNGTGGPGMDSGAPVMGGGDTGMGGGGHGR
jgi:hypothetical protein